MTSKALAAPAVDSDAATLVDWLELSAFFDEFQEARLDEIEGLLWIQGEGEDDNIGDKDARSERLREEIEGEVARRSASLQEAYPFELSSDAETFTFRSKSDREGSSLYLFCLILSHVHSSPILRIPPVDGSVRSVRRKHFQIFATLALAGIANGPSLSLGWPRDSGDSILQVVTRSVANSGTGQERTNPAYTANPSAKDGGIDVLAWEPATDRPPPKVFWFGQAASGANWPDKSAKDEHVDFIRDYYDVGPNCNFCFATIVPRIVDDDTLERKSLRHGLIADRTRAPLAAIRGMRLAVAGVIVEECQRAFLLPMWVGRYRRYIRGCV